MASTRRTVSGARSIRAPASDVRVLFQHHCGLMSAALMIGHHFSISAWWNLAQRLRRELLACGNTSLDKPSSRLRMVGSCSAFTAASLSFATIVLWRALRRPQRVPEREIEARQARLLGGRNVRRGSQALVVGDGECLHVAGAVLLQRERGRVEQDVDLAGHQIRRSTVRRRDTASW